MNTPADTDDALVRCVQRGDMRAFELLFTRYQHRIRSLVLRHVRDREDVDDVVQDAFIRAYRAIGRFRGDCAFYTWLYRIAINTARNHVVARGRRPPAIDVDVADAEATDAGGALVDIEGPERALARDRVEQAIHAAIRRLPEDMRSAVTLREFDGLSYEEIAGILECPVGTVRSRIFRARDAIERAIAPLLESRGAQ